MSRRRPPLHFSSKAAALCGAYWVAGVAHLQFPSLTGSARESWSKTQRFAAFSLPPHRLCQRTLSYLSCFFRADLFFPFINGPTAPSGLPAADSPLQSHRTKHFPGRICIVIAFACQIFNLQQQAAVARRFCSSRASSPEPDTAVIASDFCHRLTRLQN